MEKITSNLTSAHLSKTYSYEAYKLIINNLLAQGKVTGHKQSPDLVQYTKLNVQRMHRWDKVTVLNSSLIDQLLQIKERWIWLVLSEGWCPDSAQNLPVIAKMAQANANISLQILFRDENPEVMDQYLTNGTRSIPKLICLKEDTLEEIGTWGPRPQHAQQMVMNYKSNPQVSYKEFTESLHTWYAKDKTQTIQAEFEVLIRQWMENGFKLVIGQ